METPFPCIFFRFVINFLLQQFRIEGESAKMKFFCVLIGYFCGCFLTAEAVARGKTGKSACTIGSKNPGMANIISLFGVKWGAVTLFGDIFKTILPCMLCRYVWFPTLGKVTILYTGIGVALGHAFPFWNRFRGGRSVAVTCTYLVLFLPPAGLAADAAGLCVLLVTGYPAVGALAIPVLYLLPAFQMGGAEAGSVAVAGTALMFFLHRDSLRRIAHGAEPKTNLPAKLKKF
jgi:glycerol-3-phosphate acyltransferase PlsY